MDHFYIIPIELIEIILSYLHTHDLNIFIEINNLKSLINWTRICNLHFISNKTNIIYQDFLNYLEIQKIIPILGFNGLLKIKSFSNELSLIEEIINLKKLDLTNTRIQKIGIRHNRLTYFPKEIGNLYNLTYLDLSYNMIDEIPKEISNLYNLTYLDLSYNKGWSKCKNPLKLPKEISLLINLKEIHLQGDLLIEFPQEILSLINLKELWLEGNSIKEIPKEIENLTNLQILDLDNNFIIKLPKELKSLTNLERLYLENNKLIY